MPSRVTPGRFDGGEELELPASARGAKRAISVWQRRARSVKLQGLCGHDAIWGQVATLC